MNSGETPSAVARLCFPLDYPDLASALAAAELLREPIGVFKVGLELFVSEGPEAVRRILQLGRPVFLDLKLHDIPATVSRAVASAAALGATYLTVHASGGPRMLEAAQEAAARTGSLRLLGVTVLTSMSESELGSTGIASTPEAQVLRLAELARRAGLDGLVCSVEELGALRHALGSTLRLVTPGIRPRGADAGDQQRLGTPERAIRAGSDLLVVGRPIRDAEVPVEAARAIVAEIESALVGRSTE